ncbi:MAG: outer membrane beta-barrel protein [Pseudohongiella sp.]|nr:outer membrane beta-barrel protein [Pseudohongiella sp.]MDO9520177.1 outer membrane beta-barrel protein [Pseudohongiella sp.]MDP2125950.1 outer membrane beta-barrel protein [Pseudohongiella sp.]
MKATFKVVFTPLLVCLAQSAMAQNALFDDIPIPAGFPQPSGKALGSLHLDAGVTAGLMTTNNVYRDSSHLSSEATQLALSSTLTSGGERHLIIGTLEHYSQDFRDNAYQDMDLDATRATVFGRFVTSELTNLRLLFIDEEDILGKTQSEQLNNFTSGLEHNQRVEAIFEIDNSRYFANVMARNDKVTSKTKSGFEDDALNRSERDYVLLGGRHFSWGKAFLFGGTQTLKYQSSSTPALAERNSDENRYGIGAEYQVDKFSGDVDIFRFTQRFKSARIPDIENAWVGSGRLNYAANDKLTLMFAANRRFHETNIPNSGGIFDENIFVGGALALSPNLYLRMGPSYNRTELQNTPVVIERYELDVELGWQINSHFEMIFMTNVFSQDAEHSGFSSFNAQQANSVLSLKYSL